MCIQMVTKVCCLVSITCVALPFGENGQGKFGQIHFVLGAGVLGHVKLRSLGWGDLRWFAVHVCTPSPALERLGDEFEQLFHGCSGP
jgi:hypothetical protein